jgi:cell division protein FtsQ
MRAGRVATGLAAAVLAAAGLGWATEVPVDPQHWRAQLRARSPRLTRVEFVGLRALDAGQLWERAGLPGGTPLIDVDPAEVAARVASHPRVERAFALRLPPGRLLVRVEERTPVAREAASGLGIDRRGARFPLRAGEERGLTALAGDAESTLPVLDACLTAGLVPLEVDARFRDRVRVVPRAPGPVLWIGDEPQAALARWAQLRGSGLLERHRPPEVDLRFEGNAVFRGVLTEEGQEDDAQR